MTSTNPRAGWEKVGDQFYRKIQLYESVFDPDLELENYFVAGAPYGGAIGQYHQLKPSRIPNETQHYGAMKPK